MVVDTFHLFPETMPFLASIEKEYNFKAEVSCALRTATAASSGRTATLKPRPSRLRPPPPRLGPTQIFGPEGVPVPRTYADGDEAKAAYDAKYGADLWKEDIEQYDKICKANRPRPRPPGLDATSCAQPRATRLRSHAPRASGLPGCC